MTDTTIWIIVALVISAAIGFELALILTFGSVRKWMACGNAYKSGRVAVLHELYKWVSDRQQKCKGMEWSALNEVMDLIAGMLPENIREE